jgi:hypothetical protein
MEALPTPAAAFKGIEVLGNPWGLPSEERFNWAAGLGVEEMSAVQDPASLDVLYWVGCAGSYDERNKRVSCAFARVMQQAGVKFATLGCEETCTGDLARRLGNEYLYSMIAAANLETLNRYKPKRIVTQCPHCYHNLKKEYPDFGKVEYDVVHEAEFIADLVESKRLALTSPVPQRVTYHGRLFHGTARSEMGRCTDRPASHSTRRRQRGRSVTRAHVLLRRRRRMFLEGGGWQTSHQRQAVGSTHGDEPRGHRYRLSVLYDDALGRDEWTWARAVLAGA